MTLTRETLEVLQGGTQGQLRVGKDSAEYLVPIRKHDISQRIVAFAEGVGGHAQLLPPAEVMANARKIALVNQMADVCVKAAEAKAAWAEYGPSATYTASMQALDSALTALEEARRGQA
jgi:hypothetical protein